MLLLPYKLKMSTFGVDLVLEYEKSVFQLSQLARLLARQC